MGNSVFSEPQPQSLVVNMRQKKKAKLPKGLRTQHGGGQAPWVPTASGLLVGRTQAPVPSSQGLGSPRCRPRQDPPDLRTTTCVQPLLQPPHPRE